MAKLAIVLMILFTAIGFLFMWEVQDKVARNRAKIWRNNQVVIAARDQQAGEILSAHNLNLDILPHEKIPSDSVVEPSQVVGRRLKFGVFAGQIVSCYDVVPSEADLARVKFRAIRDLPRGTTLNDDVLISFENGASEDGFQLIMAPGLWLNWFKEKTLKHDVRKRSVITIDDCN